MHFIAFFIGAVVVGLQLRCYFVFRARLERSQKTFRQLRESGTQDSAPEASPLWTYWVRMRFPPGQIAPGNWNRKDAFERLDDELTSASSFVFLQRMAAIAPLTGVFITTIGFIELDPPKGNVELAEILKAISPLFFGALIGTGLAIFNQVLLQFLSGLLERTRSFAQEWFDHVVWEPLNISPENATIALAGTLAATAETLKNASISSEESVKKLNILLEDLAEPVSQLKESLTKTNASVETIHDSLADAKTTAENHHLSLHAFSTAAEELKDCVPVLTTSFNEFNNSAGDITELLKSQLEEFEKWQIHSDEVISNQKQQLDQCTETTKNALATLGDFVETGLKPLTPQLTGLESLLSKLEQTSTSLEKLVHSKEQLKAIFEGLTNAKSIASRFDELPQLFRDSLNELPDQFKRIAAQIAQFSDQMLTRQVADLNGVLQPLVNQLNSIHAATRSPNENGRANMDDLV